MFYDKNFNNIALNTFREAMRDLNPGPMGGEGQSVSGERRGHTAPRGASPTGTPRKKLSRSRHAGCGLHRHCCYYRHRAGGTSCACR
jgi:hypothetical protein